MKKTKLLSKIIFVFALLILVSCDNEPVDATLASQLNNPTNTGGGNNNGGGTGGAAVFKADFGGQTWVATSATANIYNGQIELVGLKGAEGFGFSLTGTTAGTYNALNNTFAYAPNANDSYLGINPTSPTVSAGSLTITTIDTVNHTISGTFAFTGYWSDFSVTNISPIVFTNGVFTNIPYTSQNTVTDSFYAQVDGNEFVEDHIDVSDIISTGFPDSYSIAASKTNGDTIGIRISQALPVGTYQFTGPLALDLSASYLLGGVLYNSESGSLTITSKTATHMEGTFSIIVKNYTTNDTKTISNGAFSVDLP
ncbi:DUF6252 family protein [Flavobacterium aciduliphilum]|uniref:Lipoprotein n=1 Tax=Flavobacterium aciduliphilum TaxID=1101402 RepID=A0A328YP41_9FLAO|nr:DUF6252 family protein [Flavobacterium aciduliphilum]RAR73912.1 hypothetical protein CLV55_103236 [Flavobacterium aciduliphilum]